MHVPELSAYVDTVIIAYVAVPVKHELCYSPPIIDE